MTPVEVLRAAATDMRAKAEATVQGRWTADRNAVREPFGVALALTYGDAGPSRPLAAHIASWHPAVALAVADWLEEEVETWDFAGRPMSDAAFAVARAYLGRES